MRRLTKITLAVFAALGLLYVVLCIAGAILVMSIPRRAVSGSPASLNMPFIDVSFPSRDTSTTLRGWFLPGDADKVILIVHGGFEPRLDANVDTLNLTHDLVEKGFSVLLFDLRGRGKSAGTGLSLLTSGADIGGAIDYLKSTGYTANNIDIIGYCSGAASTAIFAADDNLGAVVLDGCFATVRNMVTTQATAKRIPKWLLDFFYPGLLVSVRLLYGYTPVNPVDKIPDVSCPILFIHEQNDDLVSLQETNQLIQAAKNPANENWEINGALHSQGYKSFPVQYIEKIDNFLHSN
jgi:pimeloyl-ACP methyl ester carboxylesterase